MKIVIVIMFVMWYSGMYQKYERGLNVENDILELLTQYLTEERLGRIVEQDEEYNAARIHEQEVHDKFESTLTDEQIELFNDFITAASETEANLERINYQQGMKDIFSLFKALS